MRTTCLCSRKYTRNREINRETGEKKMNTELNRTNIQHITYRHRHRKTKTKKTKSKTRRMRKE